MEDKDNKESTGYGVIQIQLDYIKSQIAEHTKKFEKQDEINKDMKNEIREVVTAYGRVELMLANLKEATDEMKSDVKNITKTVKDDMKEITDDMKKEIAGIGAKAGKDQAWRETLHDYLKVAAMLIGGFITGKFL